MPINASAVGTCLNQRRYEVSKRDVLAYSFVLGATGEEYLDDARPGGISALPQFCVAVEWPVASDPKTFAALGLQPVEARAAIHLRQDSRFHRPVKPGDTLLVSSTLTSARASSRGTLVQSRIDTHQESSGNAVTTTHSSALFLGVELNGGDVLPEQDEAEDWDDSGVFERNKLHIPRELPHLYTECARIWNPIHTERAAALAVGLPDIILHGTATWALAGREIVKRYAKGDANRLLRLKGEFSAMVIPGQDIVVTHLQCPQKPGRILFTVLNHEGGMAIRNGIAELSI